MKRCVMLNCAAVLLVWSWMANDPGTLKLSIVDPISGQPTPARVELLDEDGRGHVAQDALPVGGDCSDNVEPEWVTLEQAVGVLSKQVQHPDTRTTQFYSVGRSEISLPPGLYQLKVHKGIEYNLQAREVRIGPGATVDLTVKMERWINMAQQGWYSGDGHVHIARPVREINPFVSKMMQAEDLQVTNLLQWGLAPRFHNAIQYAHGPEGIYREGDCILATGQENPRTSLLGHTITLGARSPISFPDDYLIYGMFWEEARRQGALSGFAHYGRGMDAQFGLAIDLPRRLLNFLEVIQFNRAVYDVWYDTLNTGFRLTPVAGTDYPCGNAKIPGRERFYVKIEGPFTYENWLEGVRRGRTFVTNGPILEFHVDGKGMGEEVVLDKPGSVTVEGSVRFDPARDSVERLEVIENGELLRSFPRTDESGEIRFEFEHQVRGAAWIAVRGSGLKQVARLPSAAHSAPVFVSVEGGPPLSAHPRAKALARGWLARLRDLETRLGGSRIKGMARSPAKPRGDRFGEDTLRKNRSALTAEINKAREFYARLSR